MHTDTRGKCLLCPVLSRRRDTLSHNKHYGVRSNFYDLRPCQHNLAEHVEANNDSGHLSHEYSRLRLRHRNSYDPPVGLVLGPRRRIALFHSYLQTLPTARAGTALLNSYLTAGQFNIIDEHFVYNTGSGAAAGALYLNVEDTADKTQRALATTFKAIKNTYGVFAFSGDTVTWADPDVVRPNAAAFYVCPGKSATGENALYINTGAYLHQTPSGCYDVDIHYYGGSTSNL